MSPNDLTQEQRDTVNLMTMIVERISEDSWGATWTIDIEYELWEISEGLSEPKYDPEDVRLLRSLSDQAGGWVAYGSAGAEFVPIAEWRERVVAWKAAKA